MSKNYLFTSESVTEGHPDKMCDVISDAILDSYLEKDPHSRVACEVTATTGIVTVMGEITSEATVDISNIVRRTIKEIGYTGGSYGFDADTCAVILSIDKQSEDISMGVSKSPIYNNTEIVCNTENKESIGAGDQGMMFGYASNETASYMPAPIYYASKLCKQLSLVQKKHVFLGPDGKSMVTFEYNEDKPLRIDRIVISTQHLDNISKEDIYKVIIEQVIIPVIPMELIDDNTKIMVNPAGRFVKGGPCADTGLTGRKIIVDTYGGMGRHGGGAFSGKDATKVDRTGAYAARYIAKNIVASKLADKCEVQIAYAIGVASPVSIYINTFGTSKISDKEISKMVNQIFDLRPAALIEKFGLRKPIFHQLAAYGHFGRADLDMGWERVDKINEIKQYIDGLQ